MRKILLILAFVLLPVWASAGVIFEDNYDNPGDTGWNCSDGARTGYSSAYLVNCPSPSTYDGVTHYAGEISPGGRSGNSFKLWRRNGLWTEYHGYLNKVLTSSEFANQYRDLYARFYIKIPTDWNANAAGPKFNRFYIGSSAGDTSRGQIYLDVGTQFGQTFKTAGLRIYSDRSAREYDNHYTNQTMAQLGMLDGNWHCVEIRVKLNTQGQNDGVVQLWIDGNPITMCGGIGENCSTSRAINGYANTDYFSYLLSPAIGNLPAGANWTFPTSGWYAMEFDDYVVSTSYIGPSDAPPPSCGPSNLNLCDESDCESVGGGYWYDGACNAEPQGGDDPDPDPYQILSETWESGNDSNWRCDYIQGDSRVNTNTPVYAGSYSFKQWSSSPGNYVHCFADNANLGSAMGEQVTELVVEEYLRPSSGYDWVTGHKLWIANAFEAWGAGYDTAGGQGKPHSWAAYYMSISVTSDGTPYGELTRADGLGGTGTLWEHYWANTGSGAIALDAWTHLKYRLKLNTPGLSDGIFQLWINGTLRCNYSSVNYRGTYENKGWNHLMMSLHSSPEPSSAQFMARDNIVLYSGFIEEPPPTPTCATDPDLCTSQYQCALNWPDYFWYDGACNATPQLFSATSVFSAATNISGWSNPTNALVSDNARAIATSLASTMTATGGGFDLPENAVIQGFIISVEGQGASTISSRRGIRASLTKDGIAVAGTQGVQINMDNGTDAVFTWGSESDLMGAEWTYNEVNAATFGVHLQPGGTTGYERRVDYVDVEVFYTLTEEQIQFVRPFSRGGFGRTMPVAAE